jgi:hypothetical protein
MTFSSGFSKYLRGEGLADRLVADAHVGDQQRPAFALLAAPSNRQRLAKRQELRIFLDIGDKREHPAR